MKNWVLIAVLVLIIILFSCQKKQESTSVEKAEDTEKIYPVAQEIENNISLAVVNLSEGKVAEGAQLLLDAVLLTRPSEYMPEGFEEKIFTAKDQFLSGNISNALEFISDALLLVKPPSDTTAEKDNELPKETEQVEKTEEIAPIAELVRNKILATREQFQKGNTDQGAVLILESLLLLGPRKD
jgi:hypothetical protein